MRLPHRRAHRAAWIVLAVLLPLLLEAGFALRPAPAMAPLRLTAP
jgi:hypothetical protein